MSVCMLTVIVCTAATLPFRARTQVFLSLHCRGSEHWLESGRQGRVVIVLVLIANIADTVLLSCTRRSMLVTLLGQEGGVLLLGWAGWPVMRPR